jgi:carboxyl-terminal processing protease
MIMSEINVFSQGLESTWAVLVSTELKCAVLLAMGCLLARLARRRSAATRHLVWLTALTGTLALPFFEGLLPSWRLPIPADGLPFLTAQVGSGRAPAMSREPAPDSRAQVAMLEGTALDRTLIDTHPDVSVAGDAELEAPSKSKIAAWPSNSALAHWRDPRPWLLTVWMAGAAIMALRLVIGISRLQRLARESGRVGAGRVADVFERAMCDMGLDRPVTLAVTRDQTIPMTWGTWPPVVLLPRDAENWPEDRLRVVLLHELAHVARNDYAWQLVGALARAVHWINPLAWWGFRKLKAELEQASDNRVLSAGADANTYAFELLHVTARYPLPRFTPSAALAIGRPARLQRRLESILDETRNRRPLSARIAALVGLTGFVAMAVIASFGGTVSLATEAAKDASLPAAGAAPSDDGSPPAATAKATATAPLDGADAPAEAAQPAGSSSRLSSIRAKILDYYVKSPDERALEEGAIRGMLQALNDPHAEFLPGDRLKELFRSLEGALTGIGAQMSTEGNQLVVVTPLPGSPARTAGIKAGDVVLAVDGKSVIELGADSAIAAIRGPVGTVVSLRLKRAGGEESTINVTRGAIRMPSVKGLVLDESGTWNFWLDQEARLGYMQITDFSRQTADNCRSALKDLTQAGVKGLVLDLRRCPGGMLDSVVETAGLFLNEGTIVTIKASHQPDSTRVSGKTDYAGDFPLVVLIDQHTASAAEILAGALKDNSRATLLGTRTFGKGSVQSIVPIEGHGAIRLTSAYFYLPSGKSIDRQSGLAVWGVDPTDGFYVPLTPEQHDEWLKRRQKRDILDGMAKMIPSKGQAAILAAVESELADIQLAAAYKALSARVAGGAITKVGQSEEALKAHIARRDQLLKQRGEAQKNLEQIEKELSATGGTP